MLLPLFLCLIAYGGAQKQPVKSMVFIIDPFVIVLIIIHQKQPVKSIIFMIVICCIIVIVLTITQEEESELLEGSESQNYG